MLILAGPASRQSDDRSTLDRDLSGRQVFSDRRGHAAGSCGQPKSGPAGGGRRLLAPFLLVVVTSLRRRRTPSRFRPTGSSCRRCTNYAEQLANQEFFRAALNSLVIASCTAIAASSASSPAMRWRGFASGSGCLRAHSSSSVPFRRSLVIPYYLLWRDWTSSYRISSYLALIVMYLALALPLLVWMLRSFFVDVPVEIEEAAHRRRLHALSGDASGPAPDRHTGIVAAAGLSFILIGTNSCSHSTTPAPRRGRCRSRSTITAATSKPTGRSFHPGGCAR